MQLLQDGISHIYEEHEGVHNWQFCKDAIERQFPYIVSRSNGSLTLHRYPICQGQVIHRVLNYETVGFNFSFSCIRYLCFS